MLLPRQNGQCGLARDLDDLGAIGGFQAVQHRLAACHQLARGARLLALKAAWSGDPADAARYNTRYRNPALSHLSAERIYMLYTSGGLDAVLW